MTDEPMRPDPDRLLEQTAEAHRGKLKIFFGACAGVGKTFAMLTEAQRLRAQGLDILIGVVETHGRKETAALLTGLATQPPQRISHRGRLVTEFDLDAALARRPGPIIGVTALQSGAVDIPLERLLIERALSVNTAAAGGNASLMTIG